MLRIALKLFRGRGTSSRVENRGDERLSLSRTDADGRQEVGERYIVRVRGKLDDMEVGTYRQRQRSQRGVAQASGPW